MTAEVKTRRVFDNRFEILAIVGRGAQSVVYHARHMLIPSQEVAIKVLINLPRPGRKAENLHEKLRKEALAMVSARHRYVVRIDDFHTIDQLCYLSMEYAPEGDLRRYVKQHGGKLDTKQAEMFFKQCAEGLNFVHKAGILHRDIKPENILVMNDREIRLADFGVAVLPGESFSVQELQAGVGTMDYMAPEVLEGIQYREGADIYALAVTFYELISGKHPFAGMPLVQQIEARKNNLIEPISSLVPGISKNFARTLMDCLFADQQDRIQSCFEIHESLNGKFKKRSSSSPVMSAQVVNQDLDIAPADSSAQGAPPVSSGVHSIYKQPPVVQTPTSKFQGAEANVIPDIEQEEAPVVPVKERIENPFASPLSKGSAGSAVDSIRPLITDKTILELGSKKTVSLPRDLVDKIAEPLSPPVEQPKKSAELPDQELEQDRIQPVDRELDLGAKKSDTPRKTDDVAATIIDELATQISPLIPSAPEKKISTPNKETAPVEKQKSMFELGKKSERNRRTKFALVATVVVLGVILLVVKAADLMFSERVPDTVSGTPSIERVVTTSISELADQFPRLPQGAYVGKISGLLSKEPVPLLLAVGEDKVSVILGIEGWTPRDIDISELSKGDPLTASSNGIIIRFEVEGASGNTITGTFLNRTSGDKGTWTLKARITGGNGGK